MTQVEVRDLLVEAVHEGVTKERQFEILMLLSGLAEEVWDEAQPDVRESVSTCVAAVFHQVVTSNDPSRIIGVFPFFAYACCEDGNIDFSLMSSQGVTS